MINQEIKDLVTKEVASVFVEARALRQSLHQNPELTWQEEQTSQRIRDILATIEGVTLQEPIGKYGVVGIIQGHSEGPCVALRADMDGLPVLESNKLTYASVKDHKMHACGHDGHMANLIGAAKVLARMRHHLRGTVKLIFQPAEEGGAGAKVLCEEGVLENPHVDVVFGLHGWPELPCGNVGFRAGPILASTDEVEIVVEGAGGHAGFPHLCNDTILASARIIEGLQSLVSRKVAPNDAVVLSITEVHGGSANNVIPKQVRLRGTLRTINEETRVYCKKIIAEQASAIAQANSVSAVTTINSGYPVTVNDSNATQFAAHVAEDVLGTSVVSQLTFPSMGGEDFSYYLQRVPGTFFFLGLDDGRTGGFPSLHRPDFDFNDEALKVSIAMFVHLALAYAETSK